jgi:predicted DNA binding CopG/RHH family protein
MKKYKLDTFEQDIENSSSNWVVANTKTISKVNKIIDNARKTKNVNIRISENDLVHLKERSSKEGLPYQTLISSVLHKYVTNQFVEEQDMLQSIKLLQATN